MFDFFSIYGDDVWFRILWHRRQQFDESNVGSNGFKAVSSVFTCMRCNRFCIGYVKYIFSYKFPQSFSVTLWNGLNFIPETFLDFYREIAKKGLREEVIYAVSLGHLQGYQGCQSLQSSTWCKHRIFAQCLKIAEKVSFNIASEASYFEWTKVYQKWSILASFWVGQTELPDTNFAPFSFQLPFWCHNFCPRPNQLLMKYALNWKIPTKITQLKFKKFRNSMSPFW